MKGFYEQICTIDIPSMIKLPKTPSVIAEDTNVIVLFEDGSEMLWGEEKTSKEAKMLAKELEIELRAVNYVRWHVRTFIQEMTKQLASNNIDSGLLKSIMRDGHFLAHQDIDEPMTKSILFGAQQKLRTKVLSKTDNPRFIV